MKKIEFFSRASADRLIWFFIGAYVLAFNYICFLKYYSFGYLDWDFASDLIVLWNSAHGRMLYYPFLEQNIFGAHLYLIIFFILPIFALAQHPLTILFLQTLFLGLAAWPLYLLARLKVNAITALAIAVAYLLYPSVGYINLSETHFEIYEIFFLFFALFYFEKKSFARYLIFIFLALCCKENVSLVVFMLGLYAILRKRSPRWILVPLALGLAWFFIAVKVVIPFFARDARLYPGGFIFSVYYQHLGNSIPEMIKTVLTHPLRVAQYAFTPQKLLYVFYLLLPTGFFIILSPAILGLTLPIFMQNLLSSGSTHAQINFQYVSLLIPFIFGSLVFAFKKISDLKTMNARPGFLLALFLVAVLGSGWQLDAPQLLLKRYADKYRLTDYTRAKEVLLHNIPLQAKTIATFQFLPRLANRHGLYSFHLLAQGTKMYSGVKYELPEGLEYAVLDFNEPLMLGFFFPPNAPSNIVSFLQENDWRVEGAVEDVVLFKKGAAQSLRLCELVPTTDAEHLLQADFGKQIRLVGYDMAAENNASGKFLHFVFYWKRFGQVCGPLGFWVQFFDKNGKIKFDKVHVIGYRVYLPETWQTDQIFKEHYYALIPSDIEAGGYHMKAAVFRLEDGMILPVKDETVAIDLGRVILGDVRP